MVAPLSCQPNSGVAFAAASLWGLARRLPVLAFFFSSYQDEGQLPAVFGYD